MFGKKTQFKFFIAGLLAFLVLIVSPSFKNMSISPFRTGATDEAYSLTIERAISSAEVGVGKAVFNTKRGTAIEIGFSKDKVYAGGGVIQLVSGASFYNITQLKGISSIEYLLDQSEGGAASLYYGNDPDLLNEGSVSLVTNYVTTTIDFDDPIDYFAIKDVSGNVFIKKIKIYFACYNDYSYLDDRETSSGDLFYTSALEQSFSWAYVHDRNCFDVANSSSGYSFHLTVNSNASGWPTWNYNFGSTVGAINFDIEFYAKGIGHTTYNLMLLDGSNTNILSYNRSFTVSESWQKISISSLNVASGKSLADVQKVKLSADYSGTVGVERHLYLDQLKLINLLESPSRNNLEVVEYTRPSTTQTAVATYDYEETYGNSSTVSRKLDYTTATGFGSSASSTFRAFATFNIEASLGANNGIDAKNCTLSFDIKFSDTFLSSPDSRVGTPRLDVTDSVGTSATLWNISFTVKSGWIHFSKNLSGSLTSLNGNTKTLRFGFYGVYTGNLSQAQIYIDNLALTANS